jgi:hypothetical protein
MLLQAYQVSASTQDITILSFKHKKPSSSRPKNTLQPWSAAVFSSTSLPLDQLLDSGQAKPHRKSSFEESIPMWVSLKCPVPRKIKNLSPSP